MSPVDDASQNDPAASMAWVRAARRGLDGAGWPGHEVLIVSSRAGARAPLERRLGALLGGRTTDRGEPVRLLVVEERTRHPGNLIGTLLAWQAACHLARQRGWDLDDAWRRGGLRVAIVHAAGQGRRAAPLVHAEHGDRGAIHLPGRLGRAPARLLETVLVQTAPLAASQPPGVLDVLWASQVFVPTVSPDRVTPPRHPLTKLVTRCAATPLDPHRDLGLFRLEGDTPAAFHPQGTPGPVDGPVATDLGSSRWRADLLDALRARFATPRAGPRDLDPHLTAPLLGRPDPHGDAAALREALGDDIVGVTDLGTDLPWWRLRRPAELRAAALDLRPSVDRGAPLRALLGVAHPVERSWLGDRWVEGPELSWEAVREGVRIGGVLVRDSLVHDSALWGWAEGGRSPVRAPVVDGCVLHHASGGFDLERTWVFASGGPGLRGGGGLAWRFTGDPPPLAGPAPTTGGLAMLRRPRLRDGVAVVTDFLDEDARETDDLPRPELGLSWSDLRDLAPFAGPALPDAPPWPADAAEALDQATPHTTVHPPVAALALLRERVAPGSLLHRLLELTEDGHLVVGLHRGSRPEVALDAPLAPGRRWDDVARAYTLHADLETWERWQWAPPRIAEALLVALGTHLVGPGHADRHTRACGLRDALRAGVLGPRPAVAEAVQADRATRDATALLHRIAAWSSLDDPDHRDLAALFTALDDLRASLQAVRDAASLRAWVRWRLDHHHLDSRALTDELGAVDRTLLDHVGFRWSHPWVDGGHSHWVPSCDLHPLRPPDEHLDTDALADRLARDLDGLRGDGPAPTLGICGPAAAGKSHLAVAIAERLDDAGLTVGFIGADELTWRGPDFRYQQHATHRTTRLYGPAIYDDVRLAWRLDALRAACDVVVCEGVYVGLDTAVRDRLDLRVGVVLDDARRLEVKARRDALHGGRRIDVVSDFAAKIAHESHDGVRPALRGVDRIWERTRGALWRGGLG